MDKEVNDLLNIEPIKKMFVKINSLRNISLEKCNLVKESLDSTMKLIILSFFFFESYEKFKAEIIKFSRGEEEEMITYIKREENILVLIYTRGRTYHELKKKSI